MRRAAPPWATSLIDLATWMGPQLRVAVNARLLDSSSPPLARLTAAHLLNLLAGAEGLRLDLVAGEMLPETLTGGLDVRVFPARAGGLGAALQDQIRFPRIARRLEADLLLYLHGAAPLAGSRPCAAWYGDGDAGNAAGGVAGRIARSLALAGLRGASIVLVPDDLPPGGKGIPWQPVSPIVPMAVVPTGGSAEVSGLPDGFVLAAGESARTLALLLAAWTWVESSTGDSFPLLVLASDEASRQSAQCAIERSDLSSSARAITLSDIAWPTALRRASLLLHGGRRENAAALRWAMAAHVPVVAAASPVSASILGPAGYLAQPAARALGAACLSVLVDDALAEELRSKGADRARGYLTSKPGVLEEILRRVARAPSRRSPSVLPD